MLTGKKEVETIEVECDIQNDLNASVINEELTDVLNENETMQEIKNIGPHEARETICPQTPNSQDDDKDGSMSETSETSPLSPQSVGSSFNSY